LKPATDELVIDKPGKGAFYNTDLQQILQARGITTLIFTGVTTEVCVSSTVREATDRGYECIVVADACASYLPDLHDAALRMITAQGGIFGQVISTDSLISSLESV
jgi:biuret amidohydrolase